MTISDGLTGHKEATKSARIQYVSCSSHAIGVTVSGERSRCGDRLRAQSKEYVRVKNRSIITHLIFSDTFSRIVLVSKYWHIIYIQILGLGSRYLSSVVCVIAEIILMIEYLCGFDQKQMLKSKKPGFLQIILNICNLKEARRVFRSVR